MSKAGTQGGGKERDVLNYKPPQGPSNIGDAKSPGLHGSVYRQGTQGPTPCDNDESGGPGLGGDNSGMGTNRSG
jgi:hypothetical protein